MKNSLKALVLSGVIVFGGLFMGCEKEEDIMTPPVSKYEQQ